MRNKICATQPVIVLDAVGFAYGDSARTLEDISFKVMEGERLVLLGHNGSGKSTLVKIMGALQTPSQGACFVYGRDTSQDDEAAAIHQRVGVVFQNPESQIIASVVEDDAAFAPENQGLPPELIEKKIAWALEQVGLLNKRSVSVSALSGGEKQRLALAGALASDARCLILDEATSMLDPDGRLEVETMLRSLHNAGTTIVQVTHKLAEIAEADRVIVLRGGKIAWQGIPEDFWALAEDFGFELPASHVFRRHLRRRDIDVQSADPCALAEAVVRASLTVHAEDAPAIMPRESLLFAVKNLSCHYNSSTPLATMALEQVSFSVPKGAWLSVLGRTGSGKSTLIQHLNGLYQMESGEILFEGQPLPQAGPALRELRRRVGMVFQSPEDQFFSPTVREELAFAPSNWGFNAQETAAAIDEALADVGLGEEYLELNPLALSGGQKRLVAIASVLTGRPECLVLDEPTSGLDAAFRRRIVELLCKLKADGHTIITVTHDLEMALSCSDELLLLADGREQACGTVRGVLPALLDTVSPRVWPDALRITYELRRRGVDIPLMWDIDELCRALGI